MQTQKKIGILGLGNLLLADEGFGVHFVQHLTDNYEIPDHVAVLDGGTAGIMMAPFIEDVDILYVIDTVALEAEPGTIRRYLDSDVQAGNLQVRMSPHQVGLLDILDLCRVRETAPEQTEMLTIVPEDLSTRIGLSPRLEARIPDVFAILAESLAGHQTTLTAKLPLSSA